MFSSMYFVAFAPSNYYQEKYYYDNSFCFGHSNKVGDISGCAIERGIYSRSDSNFYLKGIDRSISASSAIGLPVFYDGHDSAGPVC